jgi:hypothetical protein
VQAQHNPQMSELDISVSKAPSAPAKYDQHIDVYSQDMTPIMAKIVQVITGLTRIKWSEGLSPSAKSAIKS